ncbi:MAG: FimB/Mfa2 family fimbrial subunit, partial [Prevotella sp.]|nr:FimB/Mfa2 family fimbrial subunit [Prevotella sp.]
MKKFINTTLAVMVVYLLTACEKELATESSNQTASTANSELTITTRAASGETEVSLPVTLYVMDNNGICVKKETLTSTTDGISMELPAGKYHVYAIGGAKENDYILPATENATAQSEIALKSSAKHDDLMTASSDITLKKNQENQLTLGMSRKVMKINMLTINGVPADISAVSITLQPLYKALLLDGSYGTATTGETINLTKQTDGTTWKSAEVLYMFPQAGSAIIKVSLTKNGQSQTYTYTCTEALTANHEYNIEATYVDNQNITMQGSINGVAWGTNINISFNFGNEGNEDDDNSGNDTPTEPAPTVNTMYKDCFVMSVADDGDDKVAILLHKKAVDIVGGNKTESQILSEIDAALPSFSNTNGNGITGWRIPTREELENFNPSDFNTAISNDSQAMQIKP